MSSRLESRTRTRNIPSPLVLSSSAHSTSSGTQLLYDLPQSAGYKPPPRSIGTRSPTPTSSRNRNRSPFGATSPPFATAHLPRTRDPTSPPPLSKRTPPPSRPLSTVGSELETFAANCRAWYFQQDAQAGQAMDAILAKIPSSQRAQYSRLQAQIRSSYHTALAMRRISEFQAHLSSTRPGGSLTPAARADPHGKLARRERLDRLTKFVQVWAVTSFPGTKPFFEGLWAVLRLQSLPETLGGAGSFRMEWEIDDAVFRESAGKEFMLEAIDILKGVLAFEESIRVINKHSALSTGTSLGQPSARSTIHRPTLEPILSNDIVARTSLDEQSDVPTGHRRIISTTKAPDSVANRNRAPSDPFTDAKGNRATLFSRLGSQGSNNCSPSLRPLIHGASPKANELPTDGFELEDTKPISTIPPVATDEDDELEAVLVNPTTRSFSVSSASGTPVQETDPMRTWIVPDLPNTEILSLLAVFPASITRGTLPRFTKLSNKNTHKRSRSTINDLEAQTHATGGILDEELDGDERETVKFGTGKMWVSGIERSPSWQGTAWERFIGWWKRVFC